MRGGRLVDALCLGLLTGFLPCGLLYGMLALAANTRGPLTGGLLMVCFGLGTVPALLVTGCGASLATIAWRRRLYQLAGWCLIITGAITISRGIDLSTASLRTSSDSCPFCSSRSSAQW
jgi:sulfite exporter TauE/SafE